MMGEIPILTIIEALLSFVAIIYYIAKLIKTRGNRHYDAIFSQSSQITFLVFILMFGVLLVQINVLELGAVGITKALINFLTVVSVVNMLSVMVYSRKLTKQPSNND